MRVENVNLKVVELITAEITSIHAEIEGSEDRGIH